jgi:hypothetical protein
MITLAHTSSLGMLLQHLHDDAGPHIITQHVAAEPA